MEPRIAVRWRAARALIALGVVVLTASCGSDSGSNPDDGATLTVLDVTLNLVQGENCDVGATARNFVAVAGAEVTITVSGPSNRNVEVGLYDPDFITLLAYAESSQGTARIVVTPTEAGTHHINVCERDGLTAAVRLRVTREVL